MNPFDLLKQNLESTCFILEGETVVFTSRDRGVKPLLDFYEIHGNSRQDLLVVDKIVGRGAVVLAKLINTTKIFTPVISQDALSLAYDYGISVTYETLVPYIENRQKTGRCPIESSVLGISDPVQGRVAILAALEKLRTK